MTVEKQQHKQHKSPWLDQYSWKPGQSGNPKGRPIGKTLKEWAKDFLMELPDEEKLEFLKGLPADIVWRMAEGNPANNTDITSKGLPIVQLAQEILDKHDINISPEQDS